MMYNCGWCGKVDKEYIESCQTDACAMKPSRIKKCSCDVKCESAVDKRLGYSVKCSGNCNSCSVKCSGNCNSCSRSQS